MTGHLEPEGMLDTAASREPEAPAPDDHPAAFPAAVLWDMDGENPGSGCIEKR
jgi:hypothetical protein